MDRFLERSVWLPTVLLATVTVAHPATRGFVPLFAVQIGIPVELVAWYFLASGATALFGRVLLGRLSDRFGRGPMLVVGYLFLAGGLVVFALADGLTALLVAGVLHGVGDAILIPGNLALAIDLGDPSRRGAAMATFTLAFQVGVAVGAALAGVIIELAGYRPMYLAIASFSLIGLTLVAVRWGSLPRRTRVQ